MVVLVDVNISGHLLLDLLKLIMGGLINIALVIYQHNNIIIILSLVRLWELHSVKVVLTDPGGLDILHSIPTTSSGMV